MGRQIIIIAALAAMFLSGCSYIMVDKAKYRRAITDLSVTLPDTPQTGIAIGKFRKVMEENNGYFN